MAYTLQTMHFLAILRQEASFSGRSYVIYTFGLVTEKLISIPLEHRQKSVIFKKNLNKYRIIETDNIP